MKVNTFFDLGLLLYVIFIHITKTQRGLFSNIYKDNENILGYCQMFILKNYRLRNNKEKVRRHSPNGA